MQCVWFEPILGMVMVEEMLFFIVFITMLSLQRENRLKPLDECNKAVKCKHTGNHLHGSLQHFFYLLELIFFLKTNNQKT